MATLTLTSPLTTLGTTISTPSSYHTARTDGEHAGDVSALTSVDDFDEYDETLPVPYREAAQLPYEVKNQIQIHLEERLYPAALSLLHDLLSQCASFSPPSKNQASRPPEKVYVPPPHQLAFLSSLAIHPRFTSAPLSEDKTSSSTRDGAAALSYLRGLLSVAGPVNANFRQAFEFKPAPSSLGRIRRSKRGDLFGDWPTSDMSGTDSDASSSDVMGGTFAKTGVLWHRATDFWQVLGWSFWCAAFAPGRWNYWKPWLEFVVTVLEQDWDDRLAMDEKTTTEDEPYPMLRNSLLVNYLEDINRQRKHVLKEVMRALTFALEAGEKETYGEVFPGEKVVGSRQVKRKRADTVLDLENGCFGDYEDDDLDLEGEGDSQEMPSGSVRSMSRVRRRTQKAMDSDCGPPVAMFRLTDGVAETIPLRLRIFRLLSAAAHYLPDASFPTPELYQSFSDKVRTSPLPVFRLFMEAHNDLPGFVKVSLYRNIVDDLLPNGLPDPGDVDPESDSRNGISEVMMQKCFLPFPAGRITAEDNAKLSLLLENMLWYLYSATEVTDTKRLKQAIETGIKAREAKIKGRGRGNAVDKLAREMLTRSTNNLRLFVRILGC
ncbi:hypothetical protein QBC40DRAFT_332417 [Triangularia verruculosa]|uniref:Uncharacterized protein n=1 Tax=Triangularia verruculosa TaxID=2587418 RepID=A0AAN6XTS2_9PEZI|nr:hypothetical protein QBC40DRAFT_332417 [Triangularia verruculosa]